MKTANVNQCNGFTSKNFSNREQFSYLWPIIIKHVKIQIQLYLRGSKFSFLPMIFVTLSSKVHLIILNPPPPRIINHNSMWITAVLYLLFSRRVFMCITQFRRDRPAVALICVRAQFRSERLPSTTKLLTYSTRPRFMTISTTIACYSSLKIM